MKGFLRGLLTIWITILLIIFGLVLSIKSILIDTADTMIKKEISNNIVSEIKNYENEEISEEVITQIKDTIENNKEIKKIIDTYFDKALDILVNDSTEKIDVSNDLNILIDEGEKILNDNGITITEEEKKELLSMVSTDEVNNLVNNTIVEVKENLTSETKTILDTYKFLTSNTFKLILVSLIIISLLLIALLKRSYYKWLSNFGSSSIVAGLIVGVLLPFLISTILSSIKTEEIVISTSSLNTYGYILIAIGMLSIILNIVISKILSKDKNVKNETD